MDTIKRLHESLQQEHDYPDSEKKADDCSGVANDAYERLAEKLPEELKKTSSIRYYEKLRVAREFTHA